MTHENNEATTEMQTMLGNNGTNRVAQVDQTEAVAQQSMQMN
jgi:hypothetical protein